MKVVEAVFVLEHRVPTAGPMLVLVTCVVGVLGISHGSTIDPAGPTSQSMGMRGTLTRPPGATDAGALVAARTRSPSVSLPIHPTATNEISRTACSDSVCTSTTTQRPVRVRVAVDCWRWFIAALGEVFGSVELG